VVKPVEVRALPAYKIWIRFSDGSQGEVDLSPLLGKGVFAAWREKGQFEKVHIDAERGAIAWGGDIDLCPDTLYMRITGKKPDDIYPNLRPRASNA